MKQPQIFFIAAEPSADLHTSLLAAELSRRGEYALAGAGGPLMRAAGVATDFDSAHWAVMGLPQAIRRLPEALRVRGQMLRLLQDRTPDLLVLVDFGGFNVNIAANVRRLLPRLPIVYFFPPRSWDRSDRDRSRLARLTDAIATPFEWSERLLQKDGANAHFVGHPVVDRIRPAEDVLALRRQLGLPEARHVIGLMPGSRLSERRLLGPQLLGAAQRLLGDNRYHFLWSPGPPGLPPSPVPMELEPHLTVISDTADLLEASDLAVMSFGTSTLEATAALTPFIGVYRGTMLEILQFRIMKLPAHYAMPNIILEKEAMPELILDGCKARPLAERIGQIMADPQALAGMREALRQARAQLGPPGAIARTADLVEATLAAGSRA